MLHPGRGRHDGLHPGLVQGRRPDLQGRFRRRGQPVPAAFQQGAALLRGHRQRPGVVHAGSRRVGRHHQVGRRTRRAAKMVVLDVDHPDVEEFIETKAREEAEGAHPPRRGVRRGPRRQGHRERPVPERQQLRPRLG